MTWSLTPWFSELYWQRAILVEYLLAVPTLLSLLRIVAPYGRHARGGFGPQISNTLGWIGMEAPAVLVFLAVYFGGEHRNAPVPLVMLCLWQMHYVYRAFIFPWRLRTAGKKMPVMIMLSGASFNCLNALINASAIAQFETYDVTWFKTPMFIGGTILMIVGFVINQRADNRLLRLRSNGERGYKIPYGGLHNIISCPNYFGEICEWFGWAVLTWSGAGLAFALYSAANLAPRALANHRWYQQQFPDYPQQRKALVPFLI